MAEIRRRTTEAGETLTLDGDLTVARIGEVHAALREALARSGTVDVEVTEVSALDVSFLQVLCSAHRTAIARGKRLTVRGVDRGPAGDAVRQAGFLRHVGCRDSAHKTCLWVQDEAAVPSREGKGAAGHE